MVLLTSIIGRDNECFQLTHTFIMKFWRWTIVFMWKLVRKMGDKGQEFSLPQVEYPLGGSSKKGSHVYFLLIVAMVLLLWHQIVLLSWHQVTMVVSELHLYQTIVFPRENLQQEVYMTTFLLLPPSGYSIWGTENSVFRKVWEPCDELPLNTLI